MTGYIFIACNLPKRKKEINSKPGEGVSIDIKLPKDLLQEELTKLRNFREEEIEFFKFIDEVRKRLTHAEIKSLARAMRNVTNFSQLVDESNALIDSILRDLQRVIERTYNNNVTKISDLIIENCMLRKKLNDYASAINQRTLDKLDKFKGNWPAQKGASKKKTILSYLPLFDFFSGIYTKFLCIFMFGFIFKLTCSGWAIEE